MASLGDTRIVNYALTGSDQAVKTGGGSYVGLTVRETSGAATASIVLYDNTAASGTILETVGLVAGESARIWLEGSGGVPFTNGIYADITGTIQGSVHAR